MSEFQPHSTVSPTPERLVRCASPPWPAASQWAWGRSGRDKPQGEFFLPVKPSCSFSPRSIESPSLGFCTDVLLPHLLEDDLGQLSDLELEPDTQNWQHTVGKDVVAGLTQREIDRQEVINGESVLLFARPRSPRFHSHSSGNRCEE